MIEYYFCNRDGIMIRKNLPLSTRAVTCETSKDGVLTGDLGDMDGAFGDVMLPGFAILLIGAKIPAQETKNIIHVK